MYVRIISAVGRTTLGPRWFAHLAQDSSQWRRPSYPLSNNTSIYDNFGPYLQK